MSKQSIHDRIRMVREASGLNLSQFADRIGVSITCVCNWEKHGTEGHFVPKDENVQSIADKFGVAFAWLRAGEGEAPDFEALGADAARSGRFRHVPGMVEKVQEAIRELEKLPVIATYRALLAAREAAGA